MERFVRHPKASSRGLAWSPGIQIRCCAPSEDVTRAPALQQVLGASTPTRHFLAGDRPRKGLAAVMIWRQNARCSGYSPIDRLGDWAVYCRSRPSFALAFQCSRTTVRLRARVTITCTKRAIKSVLRKLRTRKSWSQPS